MANLRANKIVGIGSTDAGLTFNGPISFNSQEFMYFPTGNTTNRGRGRALFGGGADNPSSPYYANHIDFVTIASEGNAVDFGDMSIASSCRAALSNAHGGLS